MGTGGPKPNRCSHPGCDGKVTHDLVLYQRYNYLRRTGGGRSYIQSSKLTKRHMYLCDEHAPDISEWMEAYEGLDH